MNSAQDLSPDQPGAVRTGLGALIVLALTCFHLLTITPGHTWYICDFGLYLQHTHNILAGIDYSRTGYLINPYRIISPAAYPPVFPLILTPFYALFGLNYFLLKSVVVVFFGAMLGVTFLWARKYVRAPFVYFYPLLLGLTPALWENKNFILSDLPFLFFLFAVVMLAERREEVPAGSDRRRWTWVLMGLLIYLSYGTRAVGIILAPSLLIHDLIRYRKPTLFSLAATLLAVGLLTIQSLLLSSHGSGLSGYIIQLEGIGSQNFYNLFLALKNLGRLILGPEPLWFSYPLFAAILALAAWGLIIQLRRGLALIHLLALCYLGVLFLFPHQPARYLFALLPLFLLWFLMGLQDLAGRMNRRRAGAFAALILTAVFMGYGLKYHALITRPPRPRVDAPAAVEMLDFIKSKTPLSSRIMFSNPRVLAFITGRESSVWHCTPEKEDLLTYIKRIRATHLVLPLWKPECAARLIRDHPDVFQELMANEMFRVYLILQDVLEKQGN